jgi:hypothetical protein
MINIEDNKITHMKTCTKKSPKCKTPNPQKGIKTPQKKLN